MKDDNFLATMQKNSAAKKYINGCLVQSNGICKLNKLSG